MIYKYSPPSEYTLLNLASGLLYCRHFADYNDPFELWCKLEEGLPEFKDTDERFKKAVAAWGFPNTPKAELPADDDLLNDYFGSLAEGAPAFVFDGTRITCFSQDADNLLMWSHYADGLRGICLQFDETELFNEDEYHHLVKVNYTDKPPVIDALVYAITDDMFQFAIDHGYEEYEGENYRLQLNGIIRVAIASKPLEWEYENELRLVIHTNNKDKKPISYNYPQNSIKGIIIGEKMHEDFRIKITSLALKLGLPIKVAKRSEQLYKIEITEL